MLRRDPFLLAPSDDDIVELIMTPFLFNPFHIRSRCCRPAKRRPTSRGRLPLDALEDRTVPTTFTTTLAGDTPLIAVTANTPSIDAQSFTKLSWLR
jgi:hypothetical protein